MRRYCNSFLVLTSLFLAVFSTNVIGAPVAPRMISIPIIFERNMGQAPSRYRFVSRHSAVEALFSSSGVEIVLPDGSDRSTRIAFRLLGRRPDAVPEGRDPLPSVSNYLLGTDPGRWISGVPNESQVVYSEIYPGIDLVFHGNADQLEHDFRIAAGANPNQIRFAIEGANGIALDSNGDLDISMASETLIFRKPVAYQELSWGRKIIESAFALNPDGSVQFHVGAFDHNRELVIDPVFVFSTYLAGSSKDYPTAVATDSAGNVYVTGYTGSTDFPIENGIQTTASGPWDAFVSKLDPTGHTLLYSTYLGGTSGSYANAIAIDSDGNIVVAGTATNNFPQAGSILSRICAGNTTCFFIASLNPSGSSFNYAGLIGGFEGTDAQSGGGAGAGSLAIDATGNAYLAGVTDDPNFQITSGTLANTVPGYPYNSTFVLKLDPTGAFKYSTIIPGTNAENNNAYLNDVFVPAGIAVDANGQVTIAGTAGPGLPSTAGVVQPTFPNNLNTENASAGFVLQLDSTASAINYATYVPGTDIIGGLAVDSLGNSYLTGETSETNLPVSINAYQKTLKAGQTCTCNSGFILKLNGTGTTVSAATYLGGTPSPSYNQGTSLTGIALDSNSNVFVGGYTGSIDFPLVDPFTGEWISNADMVLAEMSQDLSSLLFGSFLSSTDQVFPASQFSGLTVDGQNHLIATGLTLTTDFPTTPNSFQPTPPTQAGHTFVVKFDMATPAPSVCLDSWNVDFGAVPVMQSSTQTVHLTNCGNAPLSIASALSSAATVTVNETCGTVLAGSVCPISLTYAPLDVSALRGIITLTDNAVISPQSLNFLGQGADFSLTSNPTSATIMAGHSGTFTLTITPQPVSPPGSFNSAINFSCSGLPALAGCMFNPASVTPNSGALTSTLTITTAAPTASLAPPPSGRRSSLSGMWLVLSAMLLGTVGVAAPKRRKLLSCFAILLVGGCLLQLACSGGGNTSSSVGGLGSDL